MTLRNAAAVCAALGLAAVAATPANAGPYADEMGKCLVKSTSNADRSSLVRWMFVAASLHPEVKSIASVSAAQRTELNRKMAKMFETLLTDSCRTEAQQAVKYEGPDTIGASFNILGQVAARELFSDPSVAAGMSDLANYIDKAKMERVFGPEPQGK